MAAHKLSAWLVLPCVLSWSACTSYDGSLVRAHVLAIDSDGRAYDPESGHPEAVAERVEHMLQQADTTLGKEPVRRLLIHVHGGLNDAAASLATAQRASRRMLEEADPADRHYPLFVTWPSGFYESWTDYLLFVRQGRHAPVAGPLTAPIYLVSDAGSAVADLPFNLLWQFESDIQVGGKVAFDWDFMRMWNAADLVYETLESDPEVRKQIRRGDYRRGFWTQAGRCVWYWTTLAPAIAMSMGLEWLGEGSWEGMLHRANNLFHAYDEFDVMTVGEGSAEVKAAVTTQPTGAFAELLYALADHIARHPDVRYEIRLVGHSMGAIILNDALRFLHSEDVCRCRIRSPLPIRDIVYMAPACTIAEAAQSVVPFVEAHPESRFHLLTLHPLAEAEEVNAFGLVPRGSLLEWIDNFFTRPTGPQERRLGKWVNALQALHLFRSIQSRMTVKAFGVEGDSKPQQHGDFNLCPFWRRSFWDPDGPLLW